MRQKLDKTQSSELISSYECDHMTADAEFLRTIQTCGGAAVQSSQKAVGGGGAITKRGEHRFIPCSPCYSVWDILSQRETLIIKR